MLQFGIGGLSHVLVADVVEVLAVAILVAHCARQRLSRAIVEDGHVPRAKAHPRPRRLTPRVDGLASFRQITLPRAQLASDHLGPRTVRVEAQPIALGLVLSRAHRDAPSFYGLVPAS